MPCLGKGGGLAPVRIANRLAGHAGHVIEQQSQPGGGIVRSQRPQICQVLRIQREDMGEPGEIGAADLPAAIAGDIYAMARGLGDGAGIGRVADVPIAGTGGIGHGRQPGSRCAVAERGFGEGGTADIAEADKQD